MQHRSQPISMWFDHRIAYRKSSIHGTGTFALADIRAGELLISVTGGIVYTPDEYHNGTVVFDGMMYNEERLADDLFVATPVAHHYYINHACEPTVVNIARHPGSIQFVALRDIRGDEELTTDYYTPETLAVCLCGSPRCRWTQRDTGA
jgi:SET domain-containing protein